MSAYIGYFTNIENFLNEKFKKSLKEQLPNLLNLHGLISDKDGQVGIIMLELGHIETYITRKMSNLTSKYHRLESFIFLKIEMAKVTVHGVL